MLKDYQPTIVSVPAKKREMELKFSTYYKTVHNPDHPRYEQFYSEGGGRFGDKEEYNIFEGGYYGPKTDINFDMLDKALDWYPYGLEFAEDHERFGNGDSIWWGVDVPHYWYANVNKAVIEKIHGEDPKRSQTAYNKLTDQLITSIQNWFVTLYAKITEKRPDIPITRYSFPFTVPPLHFERYQANKVWQKYKRGEKLEGLDPWYMSKIAVRNPDGTYTLSSKAPMAVAYSKYRSVCKRYTWNYDDCGKKVKELGMANYLAYATPCLYMISPDTDANRHQMSQLIVDTYLTSKYIGFKKVGGYVWNRYFSDSANFVALDEFEMNLAVMYHVGYDTILAWDIGKNDRDHVKILERASKGDFKPEIDEKAIQLVANAKGIFK